MRSLLPARRPQDGLLFMVGLTASNDPVWRVRPPRSKKYAGWPFTIAPDGHTMVPVGPLWWVPIRRVSGIRWIDAPHLDFRQVAVANTKSKAILKALRNGPLMLQRGLLKTRAGKVIATRATSAIVLSWMESAGTVVLVREQLIDGRIRIDLDFNSMQRNKTL